MSLVYDRLWLPSSQGLLRLQAGGVDYLLLNSLHDDYDATKEEFWVSGTRVLFQRTKTDMNYPLLDLGVIQACVPKIDKTKPELHDSDGGTNQLISEGVSDRVESWSITCSNLGIDNRGLLYGAVPQDYTQSIAVLTDIPQTGTGGYTTKLMSASGQPLFSLASVDEIKIGGVPQVLGVDYEVVSLDRAIVRMLGTEGVPLEFTATVTTQAMSGKRMLSPATDTDISGTVYIFISRKNKDEISVRAAQVSIHPIQLVNAITKYAELVLEATVLSDIVNTVQPAGYFREITGDRT